MLGFGILLMLAGLGGLVFAFGMDVAAPQEFGLQSLPQRVANLDLMNQRLMIAGASASVFVAGSIFMVGGYLGEKLAELHPAIDGQGKVGDQATDYGTEIEMTPEGKYRVGERVFERREDAEALVDLVNRVRST